MLLFKFHSELVNKPEKQKKTEAKEPEKVEK